VRFQRLLVAEDNPELRRTLKLGLEAEGYAVRTAGDGAEAMESQTREPADVLITDLFMPESDGFEAIAGFRNRFPMTPIVAISGEARVVRQDLLLAADLIGVDATLRKPFRLSELLEILNQLAEGNAGRHQRPGP
jgi:CheY-like chemotaxis protein